ncbi:MAG: CtsR family transcriptional regulator [Oscillospiraceae bacterium]|nr:CtsR family transcriptional regulator [Oscillospiraceae bacterium]
MSDLIAGFIDALLDGDAGFAEFGRAELASRMGCVPSQINYVLTTRFSPERGYIVESRRGGGGYIRIRRVVFEPDRLVMHTVNALGDSVDPRTAAALIANLRQNGSVGELTERLILAAVGNNALKEVPPDARDALRASILKQILINLIR